VGIKKIAVEEELESPTVIPIENSNNSNNNSTHIESIRDELSRFRAKLKKCEKYSYEQSVKDADSKTNCYLEIYVKKCRFEKRSVFSGSFNIERLIEEEEEIILNLFLEYVPNVKKRF